jgi:NADH-quinone oxidoreductase subunit M
VYLGAEYRGPHPEALTPSNGRENAVAAILLALAVILGVYPALLFDVMAPSVREMAKAAEAGNQKSIEQLNQVQASLD